MAEHDTLVTELAVGNEVELRWDKYADPRGTNEALRHNSKDFIFDLARVTETIPVKTEGKDSVIVKFRVLKQDISVEFPTTHKVPVWTE